MYNQSPYVNKAQLVPHFSQTPPQKNIQIDLLGGKKTKQSPEALLEVASWGKSHAGEDVEKESSDGGSHGSLHRHMNKENMVYVCS